VLYSGPVIPLHQARGLRIATAGILSALLGTVLVGYLATGARRQAPVVRPAYVHYYDNRRLTDPFEIMAVQSDGQAYAALARDPLLGHPEEFPSRAEAAYRAQRPLLGWLAWAGSLGDPRHVPPALAVLAIIGVGFAGTALAALLAQRAAPVLPAAGVALLPGAFESLTWLGPEALGLGLAAAGLVTWHSRRPWLATVLMSAAALTRERLLVVPAGLFLTTSPDGRLGDARRRWLLIPFVVFAVWALLVTARVGAWPGSANDGRLGAPLVGLVRGAARWDGADDAFFFAVTLALTAWVALRRRHHRDLFAIVAPTGGLAAIMGPAVWARWEDFSRPILPLYAFGAAALLAPARPGATR
jgi:hypothetical protein